MYEVKTLLSAIQVGNKLQAFTVSIIVNKQKLWQNVLGKLQIEAVDTAY